MSDAAEPHAARSKSMSATWPLSRIALFAFASPWVTTGAPAASVQRRRRASITSRLTSSTSGRTTPMPLARRDSRSNGDRDREGIRGTGSECRCPSAAP